MAVEKDVIEGDEPACYDCGLLYIDDGFADFIIPLDIWRRISPTKDEGGLLCAVCMCRRLSKAGISRVSGAFLSGPIDTVSRPLMETLLMAESAYGSFPR